MRTEKPETLEYAFIYCGAVVKVYQSYITLAGRKIFRHLLPPALRHAVLIEGRRQEREAQEIRQDTARANAHR